MNLYCDWFDMHASNEDWTQADFLSLNLINLMNHKDPKDCISNLKDNPKLVALTVDPATDECMLMHHLTQVGGGMTSKITAIVAMTGFGNRSSVIRFKKLLDDDLTTDQELPSEKDFEIFKSVKEFKDLKKSSRSACSEDLCTTKTNPLMNQITEKAQTMFLAGCGVVPRNP